MSKFIIILIVQGFNMHTHPKPIHSKPPVPEDTLFEYLKNKNKSRTSHMTSSTIFNIF
jgi:hypothetical protein